MAVPEEETKTPVPPKKKRTKKKVSKKKASAEKKATKTGSKESYSIDRVKKA